MKNIHLGRCFSGAATMAGAGMLALGLLGVAAPATAEAAGLLDSLFGTSAKAATKGNPSRRDWVLHDFTVIKLVPREDGSAPNDHPQQFNAEGLRRLLAEVRIADGGGSEPLFGADELGELIEPLVQAFENARPEDDIQLLSTARRGGGVMVQPYAITARLFVQAGKLQLIANDARYEFMNRYIGTRQPPVFTFGSRTRSGSAAMRSDVATAVRPDWLAMAIGAPASSAVPAAANAAAPAMAQPAPVLARPAAATPVVPAAASPAAPAAPAVAAPANDIEQRLTVLKRLREKGLISEEEYVQKRKEILSQL